MSLYTTDAYHQHNATWHVEDSSWKAKQILRMMLVHALQPQSVCEVGCGAGAILTELSTALPSATTFSGYDIAEYAYQLSRQRQTENIRFYHADLLKSETQTFDLLLAIDLIEHIEDIYSFLRQLHLKSDFTIFHIPLDFNLINLLRPNILDNMRQQIGHIHYFTKDTALAMLSDAGYQIVDWFYTPGALELKSTTPKVARLNPARRLMYRFSPHLTVRLFGGYSLLVLAR